MSVAGCFQAFSVRPELFEGLQGFDRLSPNGMGNAGGRV